MKPAESTREATLDPDDWDAFRAHAHAALDDMIEFLRHVRERPVWQPVPAEIIQRLRSPVPEEAQGLEAALEEFRRDVLPYPSGNIHPRFWSWVAGTGSPVGMVADMLSAGMNSVGLGFDASAPSYVELQVLDWFKSIFGFPVDSSGVLVSGGSMANFVALAVGRQAKCGYDIRKTGMQAVAAKRMTAYASTETHSSVQKALGLLGVGSDSYRQVAVNDAYEIDIARLRVQIDADRRAGYLPAFLIGNAGAVNTGAIDPISDLADVAEENGLWFVVDGAFGAIAKLSSAPPPHLDGLHRANAMAFDLHKWLHQPYNGGVVLIRDETLHRRTFNMNPAYFSRVGGGLAAGPTDFGALGVELSRSFAALRVWLSFKAYGLRRFRDLVEQNIDQARYLERLILDEHDLEIVAPTALNIVNYRFNPGGVPWPEIDELNRMILVELQDRGIAAPSSTRIKGQFAIRVCITNHRTRQSDLGMLVDETLRIGRQL